MAYSETTQLDPGVLSSDQVQSSHIVECPGEYAIPSPGISSQMVFDTSGAPGAGSATTIGVNDASSKIGIKIPVLR